MFVTNLFTFINLFTSPQNLIARRWLTSNIDDNTDSDLPLVPIPFAPPSDEFCTSNSLGDDFYISVFEPCKVVFFTNSSISDSTGEGHYSCDDHAYEPNQVVSEAQLQVFMWPESCVANGPRCYLLKENPDLVEYLIDPNNIYTVNDIFSFPEDATAVSVSCVADYAKFQKTMKTAQDDFSTSSLVHPLIGITALLGILSLAVCLCGCGVMFCCCSQRPRNRPTYQPVVFSTVPSTDPKPSAPLYHAII
uniref:Uncharacterized protein n=1 Tax=Eucampia antarctica TaxID=49252 RepID=A0A7S2WAK5_9STRA|mmetsp:Transcript_24992/g.23982  ORF Transcript_24992/g.23982 Transcript_24992/m.23982 type:complete len:249 (+) Transcript_24992:103-849(+)